MRRLTLASAAALALLTATATQTASAQDASRWSLRVGVYPFQPQEHPHAQLDVGDGVAATFETTWMYTPRWGMDLMVAAPIEHDLYQRGAGKVGAFKQAPFALTMQRRFLDPNGRIQAHAGAGVARTSFFDERTSGALEGARLDVGSTIGLTVHAGLEMTLAPAWFVTLSARWFDVSVDAKRDEQSLGNLELDPYAVGLAIGRRVR